MPNEIRNVAIPFLAFLLTRPAWLFVFVASHVCPRTTQRILRKWLERNDRHGRKHAPPQRDIRAALDHLHNGGEIVHPTIEERLDPRLEIDPTRERAAPAVADVVRGCECMDYEVQLTGKECQWCAARRNARDTAWTRPNPEEADT